MIKSAFWLIIASTASFVVASPAVAKYYCFVAPEAEKECIWVGPGEEPSLEDLGGGTNGGGCGGSSQCGSNQLRLDWVPPYLDGLSLPEQEMKSFLDSYQQDLQTRY